MTIPEKLKSRKFWVAVIPLISAIVTEFTGVEVSQDAYLGVAGVIMAYLVGQSWVDQKEIGESIKVAGDVAKRDAIAYARMLEQQLADISDEDTDE